MVVISVLERLITIDLYCHIGWVVSGTVLTVLISVFFKFDCIELKEQSSQV